MGDSSVRLCCPHCPGSSRTFTAHGLKIHISRKHKDARRPAAATQVQASDTDSSSGGQVPSPSAPGRCPLAGLVQARGCIPVLRHVPKGARNQAAGKLCHIIDACVDNNEVDDWCTLLCFAYVALKVPAKDQPGNMTAKVKANIMSAGSNHRVLSDGTIPGRVLRSTNKLIESKVFEGDLRGAVRLLLSDDTYARQDPETLAAMRLKHPAPSRPLSFPPEPDISFTPLSVTLVDVVSGLESFYSGSAGGLDGVRPGHLKELTSVSAGENGRRLLGCLVKLTNFLLSGQLNPLVSPYMYGASLCALSKKDGGIRPIAVGSVFRRLAAKLACRAVKDEIAGYMVPHQLGFGTRLGCEAAIHATRSYVMNPKNAGNVVLKIDIANAFNTLERDILLREVKEKVPSLYPFLHQIYRVPSKLFFSNELIISQVGAQQGDPLGPLVFSLAIHKLIVDLESPLNIWYLDDGTIGGKPEQVAQDLRVLIPRLRDLGLVVNPSKCEFFPCSVEARTHFTLFSSLLPGLKEVSASDLFLLGSPIFPDGVPEAIHSRTELLLSTHERIKSLPAHVALVLLRMCFAVPKINYFLRTAPTWKFPAEVSAFDVALKSAIESVLNVALDGHQWLQAALPIRFGGLGVRCARDVGLPAFLASVHGAANLAANILNLNGGEESLPYASDALVAWSALNPGEASPVESHSQRAWDVVGAKRIRAQLFACASGVDMARLRAVTQSESGAWLHALPSPHLGTLLEDSSLRVAVALRLGCKVCEPHICTCGSMVEANGHHALSCRRCAGRFSRHHALNDVVRRALVSAGIPCMLEPPGLCRSDGKRPDGLTLVPWKNGKCLIWDATCVSTVAASHLSRTKHSSSAAAEDAADKKKDKYSALMSLYEFVPVAVETLGCWGAEAKAFISELGRRLRENTGDSRSGLFLEQRLAIAIQRGNAASIMGTFAPGTVRGGLFGE